MLDSAKVYWGSSRRLQELRMTGATAQRSNGRLVGASFFFREPRIAERKQKQIRWRAPDRIELICGKKKSTFRVLSKVASKEMLTSAKWISIRRHRVPDHLMRIDGTRTYVYLDAPSRGYGAARIFMGPAGSLRPVAVSKSTSFMDGGSRRIGTKAGVLWFPSAPDGVARQPTFTTHLGPKKRLLAVPAKRGRALRAILGAKLYADLIPPLVPSPCDPSLGPAVSKPAQPSSTVTLTPGSSSRLTLHLLGGDPFGELARFELAAPFGSKFEQLPDTPFFRRKTPTRPASYVRWQANKGFVRVREPPPDPVPRFKTTTRGIELTRGGTTTLVPFDVDTEQPIIPRLINGGRSLVLLQPYSLGTSTGTTTPVLLFVEKLAQPKPVKLKVPLGHASVLVTAPEAKVFYLATGPIRGPDKLYRVDPFGGRVSVVNGTRRLRCDERCTYLHKEKYLVEKGRHDDFVILFDLKRNRERIVKLPRDLQSVLMLRRQGKQTLVAVGNQLIDLGRVKVVGTVPGLHPICGTLFDAKRWILYYSVGVGLTLTRINAFDVTKNKLIGSVNLKHVGHNHHHGPGFPNRVQQLFLLADGTVLATAGGP